MYTRTTDQNTAPNNKVLYISCMGKGMGGRDDVDDDSDDDQAAR